MPLLTQVVRFAKPTITRLVSRGFQTGHRMSGKVTVAVVLSGSGVYDGSEIHEASACLVHLSREGAKVSMFAPDKPQMHVVNHTNGTTPEGETRNVLVESARIARGEIEALSKLNSGDYDALVFPGGFGAAKNLSTFAVDGANCSVDADVERVVKDFHAAKKPIGLCCISPVLAAKILQGCEVTVGSDPGTSEAIEKMGAKHIEKAVTETHIDSQNKVVTTPAFMCQSPLHEIFDGIGKMISSVVKMAGKS